MIISTPKKGEPIRADWAAALTERVNSLAPFASPGTLVRDTPQGSAVGLAPENKRLKSSSFELHPFKVKYSSEDEEYLIYLPTGSLFIENVATFPSNVSAVEDGAFWYSITGLSAASGTLFLIATPPEEDDGSYTVLFDVLASAPEEDDDSIYVPIATISDTAPFVSRELVKSALRVYSDGSAVVESLNELSGDLTVIGGKKIRVETDEEQHRIKIIYDENATDPDEEEDPTSSPCTHPGNASSEGGVPADGSADGSTHGGSGDGGANGGIPADGSDTHVGNNGCNCNL